MTRLLGYVTEVMSWNVRYRIRFTSNSVEYSVFGFSKDASFQPNVGNQIRVEGQLKIHPKTGEKRIMADNLTVVA